MTTPKQTKPTRKTVKKEEAGPGSEQETAATPAAGEAKKPARKKPAAAKKPAEKKPRAAKADGETADKPKKKTAPRKKTDAAAQHVAAAEPKEEKAKIPTDDSGVAVVEKPHTHAAHKPAAEGTHAPAHHHKAPVHHAPAQSAPVEHKPAPAPKPAAAPAPAPRPAAVEQKPVPVQQPRPVETPKPVPAPQPAPKPASPEHKPAPVQAAPAKPVPAPQPQQPPQRPAPAAAQPPAAPAQAPKPAAPAKPARPVIKVTGQPTVKEVAEKMNIKVSDFIKRLIGMGIYATINQRMEADDAMLVASEFGFDLEVESPFAQQEIEAVGDQNDKPEDLKPRSPVVTIMGHVDHGKTSLLDAIRSSDVCSTEAGAITQHIGAYRVETPKGPITFLDTPGHEAFTAMRARGAKVTDIVVLVVSATDGVMPQTVEALDHAKAAGAPIITAVNKIDLPGANPQRVIQELSNHGLLPEAWGGNDIFVELSAKKRINIDKLLEMIALRAEIMELKANPKRKAVGSILESRRDPKRGVVATVLVQGGTLHVGDAFVVGSAFGRIRALVNERAERLREAGPSIPVEVLGISGEPPHVGDTLYVVDNEREAKAVAEKSLVAERAEALRHQQHVSLLGLRNQVEKNKLKTLQVVLKADVQGSIQAIRDSLESITSEEVQIKIIHAGTGNVNESDILLAKATTDAIILAFHVDVEANAREEAERAGIEIRSYEIIYSLLDEVKAAMEGLLEPEIVEVPVGKAEVRQVFDLSSGLIAGSIVLEGKIVRSSDARVYRGKDLIHRGKISGLKRFKDDVKEVEKGFECGIMIDSYKDAKPGDVVEAVTKETRVRRIDGKSNG